MCLARVGRTLRVVDLFEEALRKLCLGGALQGWAAPLKLRIALWGIKKWYSGGVCQGWAKHPGSRVLLGRHQENCVWVMLARVGRTPGIGDISWGTLENW